MTADLLVLGAGPAGVGAAYRAAYRGHQVVVLERGQAPGGAAGSFEVGGIRVDYGSHRLHASIRPEILFELRSLLPGELQRRARNGRIRLEGRWIAFPLKSRDLLRRLPPSFAVAALGDAATAWARRPRADTFAEVLRAGLGPTMCARFYFPYARKVWGLEPDEISGEQARRRVSAGSPLKLLARLWPSARAGNSFFWYPRRGFGSISERLAERACDEGADVRFGADARRVELLDDRVRVTLADGGTVEARGLWSTIPLPALARMAQPSPGRALLEAAGRLEFRSMVLVYLVFDVDRLTPFDAHYLPEAWTPVTRISEPKNYREGGDPAGRTVLCAEVPCRLGDAVWNAREEDLRDLVLDTLRAAELPAPAPGEMAVRRAPSVYPLYRVGFERALEALVAWAESQPRLLTFGRQGLFVHDNTHHALAMAWAATAALRPDGSYDRASWAAARAEFARHVVED